MHKALLWAAHLLGGLPPGSEHVHQIVFIVFSLAGLLLPMREFYPAKRSTGVHDLVKVPTAAYRREDLFQAPG